MLGQLQLDYAPAAEPDFRNRLEASFDVTFAARLALAEKQIQQSYRPIIGIHKWFARRPGTLFRALLLAEYGAGPVSEIFWQGHQLDGLIADPFMGGGTTLFEASRLGFSVHGNDINPMSHWLLERAFASFDPQRFVTAADEAASRVEAELGHLYRTSCESCGRDAEAKYFLWVKTATCPSCLHTTDASPGRLLAEAVRHPAHVVACAACGALNELQALPPAPAAEPCRSCSVPLRLEGNAKRGKVECTRCQHVFAFPGEASTPPQHRLWAIEYHCRNCYPTLEGRQFKAPDARDFAKVREADERLAQGHLDPLLPTDAIPNGDETARLHRWGYHHYREMFNRRQLLLLGTLAQEILVQTDEETRCSLLTVLSDSLRYNNMLCRYDTHALKCQDIFSVHGFPVGLVQCENNVLGIPGVGSGGFRHFVEKYLRAKRYCVEPFETRPGLKRKGLVYPPGETIGAAPARGKQVTLSCGPSQEARVGPATLDGVFTDPPYFANVQYAELIDFCYVWLRKLAGPERASFRKASTRSAQEATGNTTEGRGIEAFTEALSAIYCRYAKALRPGAPFVFTYHHNNPLAYAPLVVAILDAQLACTAVLPAAAEMSASMHIANTSSSILDSVFVCRHRAEPEPALHPGPEAVRDKILGALERDGLALQAAGLRLSRGDLRCLLAGHLARATMRRLTPAWDPAASLSCRLALAQETLQSLVQSLPFETTADEIHRTLSVR